MSEYRIQSETLTGIADSIREKTGGSALIAPEDMATEIASISGGGGENWGSKVSSIKISDFVPNVDGTIVIDLNNADVSLSDFIRNTNVSNDTNIILNCKSVTSTYRAFANTTIRSVTINCSAAKYLPFGSEIMKGYPLRGIERVLGTPILFNNFGSGTSGALYFNSFIKEFYVVPNRITSTYSLDRPSGLVNSTLVSIANGLTATEEEKTITLSSTAKGKLSEIVGNVTHKTYNDITDTEEEFDFFTADENGTVTLMDFITNTKGWTVA